MPNHPILSPKRRREYRHALAVACLSAAKRQHRRRKGLLRLAQRHLVNRPEFAYYLSIGTVPSSISVFEE